MGLQLGFTPVPKTIFEEAYEEGQRIKYDVRAHFESNLTTEEQALFIPFFWQHNLILVLNYSLYMILAFYLIIRARPEKCKCIGGLARHITAALLMFSGLILARRRGLITAAPMTIKDMEQVEHQLTGIALSYLQLGLMAVQLLSLVSVYGSEVSVSTRFAPQMWSTKGGVSKRSWSGKFAFFQIALIIIFNWKSMQSLTQLKLEGYHKLDEDFFTLSRQHLDFFPNTLRTQNFFIVLIKIFRDYPVGPRDRKQMILMHYLPIMLAMVEVFRLFCFGQDSLLLIGLPDLAMISVSTLLSYLEGIPTMIDDRLRVMALEQSKPMTEEEKQNNLAALQQRKARMKQRMQKAFEEVPEGNGRAQVRPDLNQQPWDQNLLRNKEGVEAHEFYKVTNKSRQIKKVKSGLQPASLNKQKSE